MSTFIKLLNSIVLIDFIFKFDKNNKIKKTWMQIKIKIKILHNYFLKNLKEKSKLF